jgi:hypothetical protein
MEIVIYIPTCFLLFYVLNMPLHQLLYVAPALALGVDSDGLPPLQIKHYVSHIPCSLK